MEGDRRDREPEPVGFDRGPRRLEGRQRPLQVAVIGHVAYWVFIGGALALLQGLDPRQAATPSDVLYQSVTFAGCGGLVTAGGAWLTWRLRVLAMAMARRAAALAGLAIVVLALWLTAVSVLSRISGGAPDPDATASPAYALAGALVFVWIVQLAWMGLALVSYYFYQAGVAARRATEAGALAREARLAMLAYQINPHFLFNALNSITARIAEDAASAQAMMRKLAELLRHSLGLAGATGDVETELARIQLYVDLERARFEENLVVETEVDPTALHLSMPPFLLQPLVENAIRHGMRTATPPIAVRIRVGRAGDALTVTVSNEGSLTPARPAPGRPGGVGLSNVRQRLELHYRDHHRFELREAGGWVHAELEVWPAGPEGRS